MTPRNPYHKYTYEELPESVKLIIRSHIEWHSFQLQADKFSDRVSYGLNPNYDPAQGAIPLDLFDSFIFCFSIPIEKLPLYINTFNNGSKSLKDILAMRLQKNK